MLVVDASVVVSAFLPHDTYYHPSLTWLRRTIASGEEIVAPLLLHVEVASGVSRQSDSDSGQRAVATIVALKRARWIELDQALAAHATRMAYELRLRGADAVYVAVADRLGLPLVSWDNEHHTRAAQRITIYTPEDAPIRGPAP